MIRYRMGSVALAAALGLFQGCTSCGGEGLGIGQGQLLHRLGLGRRSPCECMPVGSGPIACEGGPVCEGPLLESSGVPAALPPVGTEPPIAPPPRPFIPPQAQPSPAGPVSKVRVVDPGK